MTGLIFGSIIAAWAAVLVPMWLRRHDERNEARSVERFSSAMHVLGRRGGTSGARRTRSVVMPARPETADVAGTRGGRHPRRGAARSTAATRRTGPTARASLARRRRRTLLVLVLLVLVPAALAGAGIAMAGWVAAAAAALLLVGFVVHLRVQARVAQQAARRRSAAARRSAAREERRRTADQLRRVPRVSPEGDVVASAGDTTGEELEWEPREVPLPTYVTKPAAPRGTDSVRHRAPEPVDDTDEALDDELGPLLERRRVVGE